MIGNISTVVWIKVSTRCCLYLKLLSGALIRKLELLDMKTVTNVVISVECKLDRIIVE